MARGFRDALCLHETAGDKAARVVVSAQLGNDDAGGVGRGVDEAVVADIDAHVSDVVAAGVEAEQVARLQRGDVDRNAVAGLVVGDHLCGLLAVLVGHGLFFCLGRDIVGAVIKQILIAVQAGIVFLELCFPIFCA